MSGKAGRSGPVGNLNAAKHPWGPFWKRRALGAEDRWIIPVLESYLNEIISDKGGADSITAGERRVAEIAQTARGAQMLILSEAKRQGVTCATGNTWDLAPGFKDLPRFQTIELNALKTLGLGRRQKRIGLTELLQQGEEEEQEQGGEQADRQHSNPPVGWVFFGLRTSINGQMTDIGPEVAVLDPFEEPQQIGHRPGQFICVLLLEQTGVSPGRQRVVADHPQPMLPGNRR